MTLDFILSGFADELTDQAVLKKRWDQSQGGKEDRYKVLQEDLEYQINTFKELGIGAIELRNVGGVKVGDMTDEEIDYIASEFKKHDMKISALGTGDGKVNIWDDMDAHYQKFERLVGIAERFKRTKGVFDDIALRIFSYYNRGSKKVSKREWGDKAVEQLKKRGAYASKKGIKLWLENEFRLYGDTAPDCVDLVKRVGYDCVRLIDDPSNFVHTARDSGEKDITDMNVVHDTLRPYTEHVHIKDMSMKTGRQTIPGRGSGEILYMLTELDKVKEGKMYLTMEPHLGEARVSSGVTPLEKYKKAVDAMNAMIKRVYASRAA